ncbi:hypothetical protein [Paenibacillus pinihumi]|uniref:hypothetical protein n=1 Tax=Paenibacillus pinihumi TaxID=669462 RepID=UPI0004209BBE|nr:hypothetical protein [Paenibacillus pinihumi]
MYIVSQPRPLSQDPCQGLPKEAAAMMPLAYVRFLQQFGEGTYRGWMNVSMPDTEVLQPFAEYDLWEHGEDSPISQQQIGECIAIGSTADGDFLAVHPGTSQLLWLPRHEEAIRVISMPVQEKEQVEGRLYAGLLDTLFIQVYGSGQEGAVYYEPWSDTRSHRFLRLPPEGRKLTLPELAGMCRAAFPPDLVHETKYSGLLFYKQLGGYIRFNYANEQEVALFYEQDAGPIYSVIEQWLLSEGCTAY